MTLAALVLFVAEYAAILTSTMQTMLAATRGRLNRFFAVLGYN
jgi:hypothetical protein